MKKLFQKSGVALVEALIAVTMMASGAVILGTIIQNANTSIILSRDYLVAQNFITEATEGIKNIRSTNWILYPQETKCWMDLAHKCGDSIAGEPSVPPITTNFYGIYFDNEKNIWNLENNLLLDLNLNNGEEKMVEYRLFKYYDEKNKFTMYTSKEDINDEPSKFYRQIRFLESSDEKTTVEIKVEWKDGAQIRNLSRYVTLYNYK